VTRYEKNVRGEKTSHEQEADLIIRLDIICASVIIYRHTLYSLHCIVLCIMSPFAYSYLFPIFVPVYRLLAPNGNPTTANKHHMYNRRWKALRLPYTLK